MLVEWIRFGKLTGDWVKELPPELRSILNKRRMKLHESGEPSPFSGEVGPLPENAWSFSDYLLVAWCVREADHQRALANLEFNQAIYELWASVADRERLMDLSFVPVEVIRDIPDLKLSLEGSRRAVVGMFQSFRQKQARDQDVPLLDAEGDEVEVPPSDEWVRRWSQQYGMERATPALARQYIWTVIFTPLVKALYPHARRRKLDTWQDKPRIIIPDDVFKSASRLIHLRYPDLWPDRWHRVRDRCRPFVADPPKA